MLVLCNSTVPRHEKSATLFNRYVKSIGQIRRERLAMLLAERGSYANLNKLLERSVRDATLSQIANQAPNSKSGRIREMGDATARQLETVCGKPEYWCDRDPDIDALEARLSSPEVAEAVAGYSAWPFLRVSRHAYFSQLSEAERGAVEGYVEALLASGAEGKSTAA